MLEGAAKSSGRQEGFDHLLSLGEAGIYKPDPRVCGPVEVILRDFHCPG